jgi:hypothetical protein
MKIELTLTNETLQTINSLWGIEFENTRVGKSNSSIIDFASGRFLRKALSRMGKPIKKEFKHSMYIFEADKIEIYLRAASCIKHTPSSLEQIIINKFCDDINQKLA